MKRARLILLVLLGAATALLWLWRAPTAAPREAALSQAAAPVPPAASAGGATFAAGGAALGAGSAGGGGFGSPQRVPQGPWAVQVPPVEAYAHLLAPTQQGDLETFRKRFPAVDPTDLNAFHAALLEARAQYGHELTPGEHAAHSAWTARMEAMQARLAAARGEHVGIASGGIDEHGRGFALIGFDGVDPVYTFTQNVNAAVSTNANRVRLNAAFDPLVGATLSGEGMYVNVNDHGEIYQHVEFQLPAGGGSRIVLSEVPGYPDGNRAHMTHVAGTVAAWGYNSNLMGMAPRLWLRAHIQQYTADITGYGMAWPGQTLETVNPVTGAPQMRSVMGTTSLGSTDTNENRGIYTWVSADFDQTLWDTPHYIHFYGACNDGPGYATIGQHWPVAKNFITIGSVTDVSRDAAGNYTGGGNINSFSSRGPTFDGRIKPDLTANGDGVTSTDGESGSSTMSGTSMATPNASGSTVLLIDYFNRRFPGHFLRSATLRALLVNTADDRGNPGPDYTYGWGIVNVLKAGGILKRYADDPASRVVVEDLLTQGQTWSAEYTYDGSGPIRVTLAWLDSPGAAQTPETATRAPRLVNDLDLRLIAPDGVTTYYPFVMPFTTGSGGTPAYDPSLYGATATTGNNFTDNVEQVLVAVPAPGIYTITVGHSGALAGGRQAFSLAVSGMARSGPVSPSVASIAPDTGDGTDFFALTVHGAGFLLGADVILRRAGSPDVAAYAHRVVGGRIDARVDTAVMAKGYWDVVVRNPGGAEAVLPNAFLMPANILYATTFADAAGLTLGPGWEVGAPNQAAVGGPGAAFSGTKVLGTYLNGNYPNNINTHAVLPPVSTVGRAGIRLAFHRWLGLAKRGASTDYGRIHFSLDGSTWTQLASHSNIIENAWSEQVYSLPAAADNQPSLYLRFQLQTDGANQSFGWNIDSLQVTSGGGITPLPPVFASPAPAGPAVAGAPFSHTVAASDADTPPGELLLSAGGLPGWLGFAAAGDGTGTLSGTPQAGDAGTVEITLSVTDGSYTTFQIFELEVLPPPLSGYDAWAALHWPGETDPAITGPLADPDGDGVPNLFEYALAGGNPAVPDPSVLPALAAEIVGEFHYNKLTVHKNPAAHDLVYTIEVSGGLSLWDSGPEHTTILAETESVLEARDNTPAAPAAPRFIRARVERP